MDYKLEYKDVLLEYSASAMKDKVIIKTNTYAPLLIGPMPVDIFSSLLNEVEVAIEIEKIKDGTSEYNHLIYSGLDALDKNLVGYDNIYEEIFIVKNEYTEVVGKVSFEEYNTIYKIGLEMTEKKSREDRETRQKLKDDASIFENMFEHFVDDKQKNMVKRYFKLFNKGKEMEKINKVFNDIDTIASEMKEGYDDVMTHIKKEVGSIDPEIFVKRFMDGFTEPTTQKTSPTITKTEALAEIKELQEILATSEDLGISTVKLRATVTERIEKLSEFIL